MMRPVNGQGGGTFGMNGDAVLRATVESEKARQEREKTKQSEENPDFANGRGDDPRARGAESQMEAIMSGN